MRDKRNWLGLREASVKPTYFYTKTQIRGFGGWAVGKGYRMHLRLHRIPLEETADQLTPRFLAGDYKPRYAGWYAEVYVWHYTHALDTAVHFAVNHEDPGIAATQAIQEAWAHRSLWRPC
jgi:hypothetical protein